MKVSIDYTNLKNPIVWLLLLWQLPQTIASLFLLIVLHRDIKPLTNPHTGMTVWRVNHKWTTCWSLGAFIFVYEKAKDDTLRHETGHSVQSVLLGLFYLFAVAIPSVILYWRRRKGNKSILWYYLHYPENWANSLGGVSIAMPIKEEEEEDKPQNQTNI